MPRCPRCQRDFQEGQLVGGSCPQCRTLIVDERAVVQPERGATIDLLGAGERAPLSKSERDAVPPPLDFPARTLDAGVQPPPAEGQSSKSTAGNNDETVYREVDPARLGASSQQETRSELGSPRRTEVLSPSDKVPTEVNPRESLRLGETVSQIELPIDPPPRRLSEPGDEDHAIADYMRMNYVAKGGMGQVSTTRQVSLGRTTAIKELLPQFVHNPQARARFLAEASITAELEHPNIVPVHDLGIDQNGNPFYSMKYVEGEPWDQMITKQSRKENIETLLKVADAIAYAHSHKIIHRDIKPENVLLGAFGEVLVMDFGLAFRLQSSTQLGAGGTLMYMAPEMAVGYVAEWNLRVQTDPRKLQHYRELGASSKAKINEKSDIYLLGAILYEILFSRPPHYSLEEACQNTPPWPEPCDELARVARRAMETDPARRHTSVLEFQQEIRECQAHEESTVLANAAHEELQEARRSGVFDDFAKAMAAFRESLKLWPGNTEARQGLSDAQISCAMAAYNKGDYNLADSLAQEAFSPGHAFRKKVTKAKRAQKRKDLWLKTLRATSFLLATGATIAAIGLFKSREKIQDQAGVLEGQKITLEAQTRELKGQKKELEKNYETIAAKNAELEKSEESATQSANLAFRHLVTATKWAGSATANAFRAGKSAYEANIERAKAEHASYVSNIALAKSLIDQNDSARASVLLDDLKNDAALDGLRDWEWNRLKFETHPTITQFHVEGTIGALSAAAHSHRFVALIEPLAGSSTKNIRLWELSEAGQSKEIPHAQLPAGFAANGVALSDDGRWLVAVGKGAATTPVLWVYDIDAKSGRGYTANDLAALGFAKIQSASDIKQLDLSLPAIFVRNGQPEVVWQSSVQATDEFAYICKCTFGSKLDLFGWQTNRGLPRRVQCLQWSADGSLFLSLLTASPTEVPKVQFWNPDDFDNPYWQGNVGKERITTARFVPASDRNQIVVGVDDGHLVLCTPRIAGISGEASESALQSVDEIVELTAFDRVKGIAFTPDGTLLLAHGEDRAIQTWNWDELLAHSEGPATEPTSMPLRGHEGEVVSFGTLGNGAVVSADTLGFVRIGRPHQYRVRWQYRQSDAKVTDGDISADKSVVASASGDGSIRLWDRKNPEQMSGEITVGHRPPLGDGRPTRIDDFVVQSVGDEQIPNVATYDPRTGILCRWNAASGTCESRQKLLRGAVLATAFEGEHVILQRETAPVEAAASEREVVHVLSLDDGKPLAWDIDPSVSSIATSRTKLLFTGMKNGTGRLIRDGKEIANSGMHGSTITACCFSNDGRLLCTADYNSLCLWDVANGQFKRLARNVSLPREVNRLAFVGASDTAQILAWREGGSQAAAVAVVDASTLAIVENAPFGECISLAVINNQVVSALDKFGSLKFYQWNGEWTAVAESKGQRITETRPLRVRSAGKNQLFTYRVDAVGRLLVDFWKLGNEIAQTRLHSASPLLLTRFVDGKATQLVAASADGVVRLWDAARPQSPRIAAHAACSNRREIKLATAAPGARSLFLASDSEVFAVRVGDKQLTVEKLAWDAGGEAGSVLGLAWSPDNSSASDGGTLAVLAQGKQVRFFTKQTGQLADDSTSVALPHPGSSLAISHDGTLLAVGASTEEQMSCVYLYSRLNGPATQWQPVQETLELRSRARVSSLAFCQSNQRLLVGDDRGRIAVWEINSGSESRAELFAVQDKDSEVIHMRFTPEQDELLSTNQSGELTVWPAWNANESGAANPWNAYSTADAGTH